MNKFKLIKVSQVKPHERIIKAHFKKLKREILADKVLKRPIIVDLNTIIVLDGHHRLNVLSQLRYKFVPAWLC